MRVELERFAYLDFATLGKILELGIYTLEIPWRDNQRSISCIPEGLYEVRPDEEGRWTGYPELQDVPNRTEIIIHPANHVHELEGCIAPGLSYSIGGGEANVWNSRSALEQLVEHVGQEFELLITSISATV